MASLRSRFFVLMFVFFLAATAMASGRTGPGFLYTRTRGKCTPQYWSSRGDSWPKMVPHSSTVSNVFGSRAFERFRADMTVVDAAAGDGGGEDAFGRLVKEATAALVNSYARKGYPYAAWEVKTLVIQAMVSESAAAAQAEKFFQVNENCG